jgi:predicted Fe-Mo cluster-binding NifX family protein
MKIAVTYEAGLVFQHFGHTANFKIYDVENGQVTAFRVVDTCGSGHGALAGFLKELDVDTLICGGIGGGARMALDNAGIAVYGGVRGDCDEVVSDFLAGQLNFDPCARCTHHDHDHGHACGSHGCGTHSCH